MSAEDNKNVQPPKDEISSEQPNPDLFVQKYGLKVLRQLTPTELELQPTEITTTQEGFKIHGTNETSLIQPLQSLNGTPMRELEARMRPAASAAMGVPGAQRDGISMAGFLGQNESLTEVLADDNETVSRMGLTHQQLADFLDYFRKAGDVGYGQFSYYGRNAFELNGRTYIYWADAYRGMQQSPFNDGTATNTDCHLVCLEDGRQINYSGLLPEMIHRYGFYEGKGTGYRLDPKRIAETAGFIPEAEDDPVATLVRDSDAAVDIRTDNQLWRMHNLAEVGIGIMQNPNYRIVPENVDALLTFLSLYGRRSYERGREATDAQATDRQNIAARLVTDNLTAQPYQLGRGDFSIFTRIVPFDFPQLEQTILQSVQSIDLTAGEDKFAAAQLLESCLRAIAEKQEDGSENPHKAYFAGLLQRVHMDPETTLQIYEAAAKLYTPSYRVIGVQQPQVDTERVHNLAEVLEANLPTLKDQVVALYKQLGMPVSDDTTLEQLLLSKESMEGYKKAVSGAVAFAKRVGGLKVVSESDMGTLLRVVIGGVDKERQYTDDELAAFQRLGVDPNLIPYAIKGVGAAKPSPEMVIAQLYNGVARRELSLEQTLSQLPVNMDEEAKKAVQALIKEALGSYSSEKVDVQELISRINAKAAELKQRGETQKTEQANVTEADVLNEYLGFLLPPFRDFLASQLVRKVFKGGTLSPIEVTLDPEALTSIPETEAAGQYGLKRKIRTIKIGDETYEIDKYEIKVGDFSLRLNGDKISLLMNKGRSF